MVVLDARIDVEAEPGRIYSLLTLPHPFVWLPGVQRVTRSGHRRWRIATEAAETRVEGELTPTEMSPARRLSWEQVHGDFELHRGFVEITPRGPQAEVRIHLDLQLPFVLERGATEPELESDLSKLLTNALVLLKERAEAPGPR